MALTVQYLDTSWIVKLLNFIGELLELNNRAEEFAFGVLDHTIFCIVIVILSINFATFGVL
jgi:hypothetical protein